MKSFSDMAERESDVDRDEKKVNQFSRIADALEYMGHLQFQRLCMEHTDVLTDDPETRKKLVNSLLKKTVPPPFEERVRKEAATDEAIKVAKFAKAGAERTFHVVVKERKSQQRKIIKPGLSGLQAGEVLLGVLADLDSTKFCAFVEEDE